MSKPAFEDLFDFSGRRNRKSYIVYSLVIFLIVFFVSIIIVLIAGATGGIGLVLYVVLLPIVVSNLAAGSQRCRDFGWTGWAMLISLIPYLGMIFMIALWVVPGTKGDNRYGPDPLDEKGTDPSIYE